MTIMLKQYAFLDNENYGSVSIEPGEDVIVDSIGTWTLIYRAGSKGIEAGEGIMLAIPHYGWSNPQVTDAAGEGYVSASTSSANAGLKVTIRKMGLSRGYWTVVTVVGSSLVPGEEIRVVYGDKSGGGKGAEVQTFPENNLPFKVVYGLAEDPDFLHKGEHPDNPGIYIPENVIANSPTLNVIGGAPALLKVVAPSLVAVGEKFDLDIVILDACHNLASSSYNEELSFVAFGDSPEVEIPLKKDQLSQNRFRLKALVANTVGVLNIKVTGQGISGFSNPIQVLSEKADKQLYWGDIHAQGALADGVGMPDEYYKVARDVACLDISALTDHSDCLAFPLIEKTHKPCDKWAVVKREAERFYNPDSFVTFAAYELSVPEKGQDHRNAYFLNSENAPLLNWRDGVNGTQSSWFAALADLDAMLIPHPHICNTNWDFHSSRLEMLAEICSDKGISEQADPPDCQRPERGGIAKGLANGYRLGIVASGDYHFNIPGRNYPCKTKSGYSGATTHRGGYLAVFASALTREAVWEALQNRSCYATTGARIILSFDINEQQMGSEFSSTELRQISFSVCGSANLEKVEIIKNNEVKKSWAVGEKVCAFNFTDAAAEKTDFYYLRVKQEDGEMAWSSPIWVRNEPEAKKNCEGNSE